MRLTRDICLEARTLVARRLGLDFPEGAGTSVRMDLPASIATFRGLLVRARGQPFLLPVDSVERVVAVAAEEVESVEGREAVRGNGSPLYLARLSDGFELTSRIRADPKLAELPVVLVTALESREHRERGIEAGANAYVVKSSFDQSNLLEIIRRLA